MAVIRLLPIISLQCVHMSRQLGHVQAFVAAIFVSEFRFD